MAGEKHETVVETASPKQDKQADDPKQSMQKQDLWLHPLVVTVNGESTVHMTGVGSREHTVYCREASGPPLDIATVVTAMVDQGWKHTAKEILEHHQHVSPDAVPSAQELLRLGAVWLLNETAYTQQHDAHAHRVTLQEEHTIPDWNDMTLRVHYMPDRFHAAALVDWTKYCRGLLVGNTVVANIGNEVPHVPVEGLPDTKDGVVVYENPTLGLTIINKPGDLPIHPTTTNNAESVIPLFRQGLKHRHPKENAPHITVLQKCSVALEPEASGLLALSTQPALANYLAQMAALDPSDPHRLRKKYKCLVCVKDPDQMQVLEDYQQQGKIITHYQVHQKYYSTQPKDTKTNAATCQLKILRVGDERFRAACVRSVYRNSVDACLAHRLWGPHAKTPAEEIKVDYVMELEVELITRRKHQLRGQLAALGFPLVGDIMHGGGKCDVHEGRHSWNRMAVQCCELSFYEPNECAKNKVPSDERCFFRLEQAWWTEYLAQYEMLQPSLVDAEEEVAGGVLDTEVAEITEATSKTAVSEKSPADDDESAPKE